ncbi:hypothetical protein, partial [Stenotrophomonas maltophilia]|uniref:hypothetical protein n=1 Tax=Stenotrophomonas maltophilia TaxID=40324 RepID=UPI001954D9DF
RGAAARISGETGLIHDFFREEIFGPLPSPVRDFLVRTALLDRREPDLCDSVRGGCGRADILEQLEQAGLCVEAVDDQRGGYR